MGKLLIVSISDHEEHIFNRVMAAIADEPDFDHISPCMIIRKLIITRSFLFNIVVQYNSDTMDF